MWRTLRHPNVHSLLGVTMTESRLVMVSEWMENGNIVEFTKENPDVARSRLVCFSLEVPSSFITDDYMMGVAGRRCSGVNLSA